MRFGQSLFAGTTAAGFITAAGVALCAAVIVGNIQTDRLAYSSAQATAGGSGKGARLQVAVARQADCYAVVSGRAVGSYKKSGVAAAVATAQGNYLVAANGRGVATAFGLAIGNSSKQVRMYPYHAACFAAIVGDAGVWDVASPMPGLAYATGVGTTFHLVYGFGAADARLVGYAKQETGGRGEGAAVASVDVRAAYILGAQGDTTARATLFGDAAVKKSGIRRFEGMGWLLAQASASVTTVSVYQPQIALASARAELTAFYILGAHGVGTAYAAGAAAPLVGSTGVTGVPAGGAALASARASYIWGGKGNALPKAVLTMTKDARVYNTRAYPSPSLAFATASGGVIKSRIGKGLAAVKAIATGSSFITKTVSASVIGFATAKHLRIELHVRGDYVNAYATAAGYVRKDLYAFSQAVATASAEGANQINDLLRAPEDRTLHVEGTDRLQEVLAEDRLLTV